MQRPWGRLPSLAATSPLPLALPPAAAAVAAKASGTVAAAGGSCQLQWPNFSHWQTCGYQVKCMYQGCNSHSLHCPRQCSTAHLHCRLVDLLCTAPAATATHRAASCITKMAAQPLQLAASITAIIICVLVILHPSFVGQPRGFGHTFAADPPHPPDCLAAVADGWWQRTDGHG